MGTPTHSALCTTENSNALTELANYQFSQDISTVCTNEHWVSALDKALKRLLWRVVFHDAESRQIRRLSISFKLNHCVTMLLSIVRSPYTLSFYSFLSCVADRKSFGKKKKKESSWGQRWLSFEKLDDFASSEGSSKIVFNGSTVWEFKYLRHWKHSRT